MTSIDDEESINSSISQTRDFKAKVLRFENYEENFKHYSKQINHALTYPNQYEKNIFDALLQHEEIELNKLVSVYNSFSQTNKKPYQKLIKQYQNLVYDHKQLINLLDDQQEYFQKIQTLNQINFELLSQYKETLTPQYLIRGVMGLCGAFLVHLVIGASSRWNLVNVYITSFYKITNNPYLIVTEDSYASPLSLFCMGLGMRVGIRLQKQVGAFAVCVIAMFCGSLMSYLSSIMPTFELFVMFSFALYPFVTSLSFHSVMNQCYKYYPKHKLLINAVIIIGTGFGQIFFGLFNTQCINPEDLSSINGYYGKQLDFISRNVPHCMVQNSYFVFFVGVLAMGLLYPIITFNTAKRIQNKHSRTKLDFEYSCATQREALTSKIFWIFLAMVVLTSSGCYFMNSNFKNLRSKYQQNTFKMTEVLFAFNFANSCSRVFWAFIFTKIGFKYCLIIITSLNIVILATMQSILAYQQAYFVYFIIGGINLGGCMVIFFNFTVLVFGEFVGQQLPGYTWTGYTLGNLIQYFLVNSYNVGQIGYFPTLIVLALFNLISLVIVTRTKLQGEWQNNLHMLELKCYF